MNGLAPEADPRHVRFSLRTECPACGAHLPVNGPAADLACAECGEEVDVPADLVGSLLAAAEAGWPEAEGAGTVTEGDLTWRWTSSPVEQPVCPGCAAALPEPQPGGPLRCPGCAATVPVERIAGDLADQAPSARWVISGERDQTRESPRAPVALGCPGCGAGLTITSRHHRITPCDRCGNQVHVPDVVWRALHPPRRVQPWFVRYEGESAPARKLREAKDEAERRALRQVREQAVEARERSRREQKAREKEEKEANEAALAAERARARLRGSLPWLGVAWVATGLALAAMGVATLWEIVGHGRWVRTVGLGTNGANLLADALVVIGAGAALFAWLVGNFAATRRTGTPFFELLPWAAFMLGLTLIPFLGIVIGPIFAWLHFSGSEPTVKANETVPFATGWPLGVLYLALTGFPYVAWAAIGSSAAGFATFLP